MTWPFPSVAFRDLSAVTCHFPMSREVTFLLVPSVRCSTPCGADPPSLFSPLSFPLFCFFYRLVSNPLVLLLTLAVFCSAFPMGTSPPQALFPSFPFDRLLTCWVTTSSLPLMFFLGLLVPQQRCRAFLPETPRLARLPPFFCLSGP